MQLKKESSFLSPRPDAIPKLVPSKPCYLPMDEGRIIGCYTFPKHYVKWKQPHSGFELLLLSPIPTTITVMFRALP